MYFWAKMWKQKQKTKMKTKMKMKMMKMKTETRQRQKKKEIGEVCTKAGPSTSDVSEPALVGGSLFTPEMTQ